MRQASVNSLADKGQRICGRPASVRQLNKPSVPLLVLVPSFFFERRQIGDDVLPVLFLAEPRKAHFRAR